MPYLDGKRVDLPTWQAAQPVRPLISLDGQTVLNADLVAESEAVQSAERWARTENERIATRAMQTMGAVKPKDVPYVTAADWPGFQDLTAEQADDQRRRDRFERQRQAIATATGADLGPERPVDTEPDSRYLVPRPQSAVSFAQERGIAMHKADRASQRPGGRHSRHVRSQARKWQVTDAVADQRVKSHPPDCEWRVS